MPSFKDHTIFNSVNPDALTPKPIKPLPFPLENLDQQIGIAYENLTIIDQKLSAALKNPVNKTPAKQKHLQALKYKIKTCLKFVKDISINYLEM